MCPHCERRSSAFLTLDVAEGKKNSNHSCPVNCDMYSGRGVGGGGGGSGVGGGVGVFGGGGVGLLGGLVRRGEACMMVHSHASQHMCMVQHIEHTYNNQAYDLGGGLVILFSTTICVLTGGCIS